MRDEHALKGREAHVDSSVLGLQERDKVCDRLGVQIELGGIRPTPVKCSGVRVSLTWEARKFRKMKLMCCCRRRHL